MRTLLSYHALYLVVPLCLIAAPVSGQSPQSFVATRDLHIDAAAADFGQAGTLLVARNGDIVVIDDRDNIFRTFNASGPTGTFGRVGSGPGEFRNLRNAGWLGDSLWTIDPTLNRISIFGSDHKFVRSYSMPMAVLSPKAPHDSAEKASQVYVQAILSDGSLRAIASFPPAHRPSWAAGVDSGTTLYVKITPAGVLEKRIAVTPPGHCGITFAMPHSVGYIHVPFCSDAVSTDWYGTQAMASVTLDEVNGNAGTYRVNLISENGVVLFNRAYPFVPIAVSKASLDSLAAARAKQNARPSAYLRAAPKVEPAKFYPPVRRVVLGRDGTVWVEERTAQPGHLWRILDGKGNVAGTVTLPAGVVLAAADMHAIWGYDTDDDGLQGIARFRLEKSRG